MKYVCQTVCVKPCCTCEYHTYLYIGFCKHLLLIETDEAEGYAEVYDHIEANIIISGRIKNFG
jgi:hypothetical protein